MNPLKLLIPALFLIVLGVGNMLVGHFKLQQYDQLLSELDAQEIEEEQKDLSPLQRLKYASDSSPKLLALRQKAEARRDLYQLVSYSGKIFLAFSMLFLVALLISRNLS